MPGNNVDVNQPRASGSCLFVDCNPHAKIASGVNTSRYTSVKTRHLDILRDQIKASAALMPLFSIKSLNMPTLTNAEYVDLVDFNGR